MNSNLEKFRKALEAEKLPPLAVAALVSRAGVESNFDPAAHNPADPGPEGSRGAFQWNGSRLADLKKFAQAEGKPVTDLTLQARFLAKEVRGEIGTEKKWGDKLLAASTPDEALAAATGLARPQGWTAKNPQGALGYDDSAKLMRTISTFLGIPGEVTPGAQTVATATAHAATPVKATEDDVLLTALLGPTHIEAGTDSTNGEQREKNPFIAALQQPDEKNPVNQFFTVLTEALRENVNNPEWNRKHKSVTYLKPQRSGGSIAGFLNGLRTLGK